MSRKSTSSNKWIFTLHHWTQTDWEHLDTLCKNDDRTTCLKAAQKIGSEGESPHLQGVVIFRRDFKTAPGKASKILMGPNALITNPDAPKGEGHHHHVTLMEGTPEEASKHCGNPEKEEGCVIFEAGELPKADGNQGKRNELEDTLKITVDHAKSGGSYAALEDMLPGVDAKHPGWMRKHYKKHHIFRENLFDKYPMF